MIFCYPFFFVVFFIISSIIYHISGWSLMSTTRANWKKGGMLQNKYEVMRFFSFFVSHILRIFSKRNFFDIMIMKRTKWTRKRKQRRPGIPKVQRASWGTCVGFVLFSRPIAIFLSVVPLCVCAVVSRCDHRANLKNRKEESRAAGEKTQAQPTLWLHVKLLKLYIKCFLFLFCSTHVDLHVIITPTKKSEWAKSARTNCCTKSSVQLKWGKKKKASKINQCEMVIHNRGNNGKTRILSKFKHSEFYQSKLCFFPGSFVPRSSTSKHCEDGEFF